MIRSLYVALAIALTLTAPSSTTAQHADIVEPEPEIPLFIDAALVGRYQYREATLEASLDLKPDGTFDYRARGLEPPVEGEGAFGFVTHGIWRANPFGELLLSNVPTAPPVLVQVTATHDPSVRVAFTIASPKSDDEFHAYALGVSINDGEDRALHMLTYPTWSQPLRETWGVRATTMLPRKLEIIRSPDRRTLATINLTPGGPNRFHFAYTPSPIQPFRLGALVTAGGGIEVEFGTASLKMVRAR